MRESFPVMILSPAISGVFSVAAEVSPESPRCMETSPMDEAHASHPGSTDGPCPWGCACGAGGGPCALRRAVQSRPRTGTAAIVISFFMAHLAIIPPKQAQETYQTRPPRPISQPVQNHLDTGWKCHGKVWRRPAPPAAIHRDWWFSASAGNPGGPPACIGRIPFNRGRLFQGRRGCRSSRGDSAARFAKGPAGAQPGSCCRWRGGMPRG